MFLLLMCTITKDETFYQKPKLDEALLYKIAEGDLAALEQLYKDTSSAIYGFALSILKNKPDAEEVMQDTYLRIYHSAGSYCSQGKPMAWILTIVKNLSLMRIREQKKMAVLDPESPEMEHLAAPANHTDDKLLIDFALNILTDEERQIVTLHSIGGLKHREIGKMLNLPLSTVLSKYNRSLRKLKKFLLEGENYKK